MHEFCYVHNITRRFRSDSKNGFGTLHDLVYCTSELKLIFNYEKEKK